MAAQQPKENFWFFGSLFMAAQRPKGFLGPLFMAAQRPKRIFGSLFMTLCFEFSR
jgi:hypothetical protein